LKKHIISAITVSALATAVCFSSLADTSLAAKQLKINKKTITLKKGQKYTLKIKNTTKKVTWRTSKKKVATVSKKGVVTAKKKGTAYITAKVVNRKFKCKVTVVKKTTTVTNTSNTDNTKPGTSATPKPTNPKQTPKPTTKPKATSKPKATTKPTAKPTVKPTTKPQNTATPKPTPTPNPDSLIANPPVEDPKHRDDGWVPGWY